MKLLDKIECFVHLKGPSTRSNSLVLVLSFRVHSHHRRFLLCYEVLVVVRWFRGPIISTSTHSKLF